MRVVRELGRSEWVVKPQVPMDLYSIIVDQSVKYVSLEVL